MTRTIEHNGVQYRVDMDYVLGYVAVDLAFPAPAAELEATQVFFTQGEDASELLEMEPHDLLEWLDSTGALNT